RDRPPVLRRTQIHAPELGGSCGPDKLAAQPRREHVGQRQWKSSKLERMGPLPDSYLGFRGRHYSGFPTGRASRSKGLLLRQRYLARLYEWVKSSESRPPLSYFDSTGRPAHER